VVDVGLRRVALPDLAELIGEVLCSDWCSILR
jgi:hypothetical protein